MVVPDKTEDRLLDLYKMAAEFADRISARRATANAFFLTLNSALLAAVGLVQPAEAAATGGHPADRFGLVLLSIAGFVLSLTWWMLLRSYRRLNAAKFKVILELERRLPAAPFSDEWRHLEAQTSRWPWGRYVELGQAERVVPLVYAVVYVAAAIHTMAS